MSESHAKQPPVARIDDVVDVHWGVEVKDPYRHLEDVEDPEVLAWFKGQAAYAQQILESLPERDAFFARLMELDQGSPFSTSGVKELATGDVFYMRRNAGENVSKLYIEPASGEGPRLLVDPEALGGEGEEHYAMAGYQPSWDGEHVVYGLAQGGSEETTYHIMNLETGAQVDAPISNIETAYNRPQWDEDGAGFYYSRRRALPADAPHTEIYKQTSVRYHQLGADPDTDPIVAAFGLSDRLPLLETDFPSLTLTPGSAYAVLKVKHGDNNEVSLYSAPKASLLSGDVPWTRICVESDLVKDFAVVTNTITLLTALDAPRYRLVQTSLAEPDFAHADEIIPASDTVLSGVNAARDALYIDARIDGVGTVFRMIPGGEPERLETPSHGSAYVSAISPQRDGVRIYESSWIRGSGRFHYAPESGQFTDDGLVPRGEFDDTEGLVAEEVLVPSHDGTMVPLSILHRADIELDGNNPTIVYGYGSYGVSLGASFSTVRLGWIERGGVYAIAHVRGGGEYGKAWHYAGRMATKPNTWLDLIACTEHLIERGYTSPQHVAPMGGSAGGILVGRSITERPELFGAAVILVGMLDTIRSETTTNGVPNIKEFGTVTDEEGFKALLAMSAYHHVKDGVRYPATLLTHGFNDPRVNPWMSGKMAARLQAVLDGDPEVLLRIDFGSGHGIGSTREQLLKQYADIYAFLQARLG